MCPSEITLNVEDDRIYTISIPEGHLWIEGQLTKTQNAPRSQNMARDVDEEVQEQDAANAGRETEKSRTEPARQRSGTDEVHLEEKDFAARRWGIKEGDGRGWVSSNAASRFWSKKLLGETSSVICGEIRFRLERR